MSAPLDTTPLQKALKALQKSHKEIAESKTSLTQMERDYAEGMESANPSDLVAVRGLGELQIRINLMPKYIRKAMEERGPISAALRSAVESLWKQLEAALEADQTSFINDHEKNISNIFGDHSRAVLVQAPAFPKPNWNTADRNQLQSLFDNTNRSGDIADDYDRDATYDRQICRFAENLLKIAAAYQPYKKA